jgi:hypothetical protein
VHGSLDRGRIAPWRERHGREPVAERDAGHWTSRRTGRSVSRHVHRLSTRGYGERQYHQPSVNPRIHRDLGVGAQYPTSC